jgi:hypothetical protein
MYILTMSISKVDKLLIPIRMAGGVYDSPNFKEKQLKMAWSKTISCPGSIPHKMYYNYTLLKVKSHQILYFSLESLNLN